MKWSLVLLVLANVVCTAFSATQEVLINDEPSDYTSSSSTTATPAWSAYWNADSAAYQRYFDRLNGRGFRPISFSAYGSTLNSSVRYSAVWVQQPGPAWVAAHNMNLNDFTTWSQKWKQQGYVSTLVSATGPESSAVFMGLMEKIDVSRWEQRCALDQATFSGLNANATRQGQILKSVREYGTPVARRYCAIWSANPQQDKWTTWFPLSYNEYQERFNSETTKPYWRPTYATESEDHRITSIWGDTDVGSYAARHGLVAADLIGEMNTQNDGGRMPIHLSGSGSGSDTRFIAFWAQQDQPAPRSWRATGTATAFRDNSAAISRIDTIAQTFMKSMGVRQAQVSIGRNGKVGLARAYSWSESTRHTTQTNDVFLLASVSKMFVAAAIQKLYDLRYLNSTGADKVYAKLGYTSKPKDPRVNDITVKDLLDHTGGDDRSKSGDSVFFMRQIAQARGGSAPTSLKDFTNYTFNRTLDYSPGTLACKDENNNPTSCYSNQGYLILSALVEKVSGQNYFDFLQTRVLDGLDVRQWKTAASFHVNDPVTQESIYTGYSALNISSDDLVANAFGGDGIYKETAIGPSSLAASATTLMRFISNHAVAGIGGRQPGWWYREGSMDGARTVAWSRQDKVDWAMTVNTRDFPDSPNETAWNQAKASINSWLDTNPFA